MSFDDISKAEAAVLERRLLVMKARNLDPNAPDYQDAIDAQTRDLIGLMAAGLYPDLDLADGAGPSSCIAVLRGLRKRTITFEAFEAAVMRNGAADRGQLRS